MIYYSIRVKSTGQYLKGTPTYPFACTFEKARVFTKVGDLKRFVTGFVNNKLIGKKQGRKNVTAHLPISDLEIVEYSVTETDTKGFYEFVKPELVMQLLGS